MSSARESNWNSVQQTLDILFDISQLMNTNLGRDELITCVSLIESGVNPEALASVIIDLRRKKAELDGQAGGWNGL